MSCRRLVSRTSVPSAPRKYFVVTMVDALTLQELGNSTAFCSKTTSPVFQFVWTTSRRSQVTSSYGWTPGVLNTGARRSALLRPRPFRFSERPLVARVVSVIDCLSDFPAGAGTRSARAFPCCAVPVPGSWWVREPLDGEPALGLVRSGRGDPARAALVRDERADLAVGGAVGDQRFDPERLRLRPQQGDLGLEVVDRARTAGRRWRTAGRPPGRDHGADRGWRHPPRRPGSRADPRRGSSPRRADPAGPAGPR